MVVILPILGITILAILCPFVLLIIEVFSIIKKLKEKNKDKEVTTDEKE